VLEERWRESEERHKIRTSISLNAERNDASDVVRIETEIRVENFGEGRRLFNPFFEASAGRPSRLCVFDAKHEYLGALWDRRQEVGSFSLPSPKHCLWPFFPANSFARIRIQLADHDRNGLAAFRKLAGEAEMPFHVQLQTDERLVEPPPREEDGQARMRFSDPAPWGPLLQSNIVRFDPHEESTNSVVNEATASRNLASSPAIGRAILVVPSATVVAGQNLTAEIGFENLSYSSYFYNAFFRPGLDAQAELSLFDHRRHYIGALEVTPTFVRREPQREDWVRIPQNGVVGARRLFRTKVRGQDRALASGTYYLRLDFHRSLITQRHSDVAERRKPLEVDPRNPLFHSDFVQIEVAQ
jgi:hypothetical protein